MKTQARKTPLTTPKLIALVIVALLVIGATDVNAQTVTFPDANMEAVVREAVGKFGDPITVEDMLTLTSLDAGNRSITDTTGLETARNLTNLVFNSNPVSNYSGLAGLTNLTRLDFIDGSIRNLSFMTSLKKLQTAVLYDNQIGNLSPLAELTALRWLQLDWNPVTNHNVIAGLTNLKNLSLAGNNVSNIDFVTTLPHLESLGLHDNSVRDLSALAGRTNLISLSLGWNGVTNPAVLATLPGLHELFLNGNNLTNVPYLAGLTNLTGLDLAYTALADMSPVTNLTRLTWVNVGENLLPGLPNLSSLTNLETFMTAGNQITDLSPVTNLPAMLELHVQRSLFSSVAPLANCPRLERLLLSGNRLTNLAELGMLTHLHYLQLREMHITNLDFVVPLASLEDLDVGVNRVTDLFPLTNLPSLHFFSGEQNRLMHIEALQDCPSLWYVNLRENYLDTNAASAAWNVITNLQDRGVTVDYDPQCAVPLCPQILVPPANRSAYPDDTVSFSVVVDTSSPDPEYRWQKDGVDLDNDAHVSGADSATLWINNVTASDAGFYRVRVWRDWAETNSMAAELKVITTVTFADANLEQAVRDALDIPFDPLTPGDLAGLYSLDASSRGITDLAGLEAAAHLEWLNFSDNPGITNFTPLTFLSALSGLVLNNCSLADASPLASLRSLNGLELNQNFIIDLSPLRQLDNLVNLYLGDNLLTNINPLLDLDALNYAYIANNYLDTNAASAAWNVITNLVDRGATVEFDPQYPAPVHPQIVMPPANCSALAGGNVTFSVVVIGGTPAANFRWQKDGVDLADDSRITGTATDTLQIEDVSAADAGVYRVHVWDGWVALNSSNARLLIITNVAFADPNLEAAVRDRLGIPSDPLTIADLAGLTWLDAGGRGLTDLSGLEAAVNLDWLRLADNRGIQSFEPLTYLSALRTLIVDGCGLSDLSELAVLTRLEDLNIANNLVQDLSPLRNLSELYYLWADRNHLEQIDPLLDLPALSEVSVQGNHLDTNATAAAWAVITNLMEHSVNVTFDPQYFPPSPPVITRQPASQVGFPSGEVWFNVDGIGSGSGLSFLWQKNGVNLQDNGRVSGAGSPELYLGGLVGSNAGVYRAQVWDEWGVTNSVTVTLRVVTNVAFVDPNLERAVRDQLGIPTDPLAPADLATLTGLNARERGITNLSGLESAGNLDWLSLSDNPGIADFTPLTQLPKLAFLDLNACGITDIAFVAALPPLNELHLWRGALTDISPLATHPQLLRLNLAYSVGITNLEVLNALTNLEALWIEGTGIPDISFAALMPSLREFSFEGDVVWDLSPLAGATNLVNLDAANNQITNAAPLASCTNLEWLSASGNQICDLGFAANLTKLTFLAVNNNAVTNISGIASLTNLNILDVGWNPVTDLAPIGGLTRLTDLHLWNLGLSNNFGFLAPLTNLLVLNAGMNRITSLPPYPNLTRLWYLNLEQNPLANISCVSSMTNLHDLHLNDTGLRDLSPLSGRTNIVNLGLARNGITDVSPLATLTYLNWVTLWDNNLRDIAAFSTLTHLSYVDLRYNQLNWFAPNPTLAVIQSLQSQGVTVDHNPQQDGAIFLVAPAPPGSQFQFSVQSAPNTILEIWSSTNLTTWLPLGYVTNTSGSTGFTDPSASAEQKFYRAKLQP